MDLGKSLQVVARVVLMDELFLPYTFDAQIALTESNNANFKEATTVVKQPKAKVAPKKRCKVTFDAQVTVKAVPKKRAGESLETPAKSKKPKRTTSSSESCEGHYSFALLI